MINSSFYSIILIILVFYIDYNESYEISLNGRTYQINVVNADGSMYQTREKYSDDFGEKLPLQSKAVCSSLKSDETCHELTNNPSLKHNMLSYFPSLHSRSMANDDKNASPHLLKETMDEQIIDILHQPSIRIHQNFLSQSSINMETIFDQLWLNNFQNYEMAQNQHQNENENQNHLKKNFDGVNVEILSDPELINALNENGENLDAFVNQVLNNYIENDDAESNELVEIITLNNDKKSDKEQLQNVINSIRKKYKNKKYKRSNQQNTKENENDNNINNNDNDNDNHQMDENEDSI